MRLWGQGSFCCFRVPKDFRLPFWSKWHSSRSRCYSDTRNWAWLRWSGRWCSAIGSSPWWFWPWWSFRNCPFYDPPSATSLPNRSTSTRSSCLLLPRFLYTYPSSPSLTLCSLQFTPSSHNNQPTAPKTHSGKCVTGRTSNPQFWSSLRWLTWILTVGLFPNTILDNVS